MVTIPQELVSFSTSVGPNLGTMQEKCSSLQEKIGEMMKVNDSAEDGVNRFYK